MNSSLELAREQFPHLRDGVIRLFEREPLFRELCEDYETCSVALARQMATQTLQREYQALRLRLETEMLRFLHEDAARSIGRK